MSTTDISIKEEAEPCELHEKLHCEECQEINEKRMSQFLKRSISYNAINNVKKRTSINNLHRTLSQTSCYSNGSTQTYKNSNIDPFNEFLSFLSNDDYIGQENILWDNLPKEVKEFFIARALAKKKLANDHTIHLNDLKELFRNNASIPNNSDIPPRYIRRNIASNIKRQARKSREQNISRLIGQFFDYELTEMQKEEILNEFSMPEEENPFLSVHSKDRQKECSETEPPISSPEPYLSEINEKIKELNKLMERLEQYSPVTTPTTNDTDKAPITSSSATTPLISKDKDLRATTNRSLNKKMNETPSHQSLRANLPKKHTEETFLEMLATKSKKFMKKFKHKKKPAKLDLYRKPTTSSRQLIHPAPSE